MASSFSISPIDWGFSIHLIHLCFAVNTRYEYPDNNAKPSDGEASVFKLWGM